MLHQQRTGKPYAAQCRTMHEPASAILEAEKWPTEKNAEFDE